MKFTDCGSTVPTGYYYMSSIDQAEIEHWTSVESRRKGAKRRLPSHSVGALSVGFGRGEVCREIISRTLILLPVPSPPGTSFPCGHGNARKKRQNRAWLVGPFSR